MAVMRRVSSLLVVRYIIFGLFTICNAITCSVAAWNYSLVLYAQPVDVYLIFLGAFSLLLIFVLIFVELLWVDALTTRVWFECVWIALFWLMELAGGAALIAIKSDVPCLRQTATSPNGLCISERVLLVFTWMCTVMLFLYLLALVFIAASQRAKDPKIWVSDVRALSAVAARQCPSSGPSSPLTTCFKKRPSVDIYTHHPLRSPAVLTPPPHTHLSDYEIESFRPVFVAPEQMEVSHSLDLPEAIPLPPARITTSFARPIPTLPRGTGNVRSLSLRQFDIPRELVSSIEYRSSGQPPGPVPGQSKSLPSPSPLGDWPRQDVMQLPARPKRKPPPPSAFEFPTQHTVTIASTDGAALAADVAAQPRPRRPSGPRLRVSSGASGHRPAPLDLRGVSNFVTGH